MMDFSALKNRQWYLLSSVCSFLVGGVVVYGVIAMRDTPSRQPKGLKSSITTGSSRINRQEAWVHEFKNESDLTKKRLDKMEDMLARVLKLNESPKFSDPSFASEKISPLQPLDVQAQAITHLRQDMQTVKEGSQTPEISSGQVLPPVPGTSLSQTIPGITAPLPQHKNTGSSANTQHPTAALSSSAFRSKGLKKISLSLKNARSNASLKTPDNTIPAGAFARAVLLGGVDASTSIQASSDPRPALLRITDPGTLPRKFRSDLEGCHALAASYGDISSERVYMRLEKLTCTERKTGEIVEVKVQGYVAGEDGRTGIRGSVVDRSGESMRNAMVGGFLGGVGEFLSQSRNPVTFSPMAGLAQTNPMGVGDMLKHGAGSGASSALSRYADFYIKRAEQLQPIIQVAAGRDVSIVFTESASLADSAYRQAVGRAHDQERYQQIQAVGEETSQKPLTSWTNPSENNQGAN